jgi:PAS domain S-box-containing protein
MDDAAFARSRVNILLVVRMLVLTGLVVVTYRPESAVHWSALLPPSLTTLALALAALEARGTKAWASRALLAADFAALASFVALIGDRVGLHGDRSADFYLVVLYVLLIGAGAPGLARPLAAAAVAAGAQAVAEYATWGFGGLVTVPFLLRACFIAVGAVLLGLLAREAERERVARQATRRELSARIADLSDFLDAILQSIQTGVLVVHGDGAVALCNRRGAELLGVPPGGLIDRPLAATPHLEPLRALLAAGLPGATDRPEVALVRPGGATVELGLGLSVLPAASGRPAGTIVVFQDITPIKDYQRRLLQQERLAVAGRIAGGVAHEFGNLLGGLRTHAEYALRDGRPEELREALDVVARNIDRALLIVRNLLSFSRPAPPRTEPVDAGRILAEALLLLERDFLSQRVALDRRIGEGLSVLGDAGQLQQVFLNILLNARQAMPSGGTLRVEAAREGGRVVVRFADTGPGIPDGLRDRIFEPFFTTKTGEDGHPPGSGLGLAISRDLVRGHGGEIRVESEPGKGAAFVIDFPAA